MHVIQYYSLDLKRLEKGVGGVENSLRRLSYCLRVRGVTIGLAVLGYPHSPSGWVREFPITFITPHTEPRWRSPRSWASVTRSALRLSYALRASHVNILHLQFPVGNMLTALIASYLPRRWKLVATFRGSDMLVHPHNDPTHRRRVGWLLQRADAVTAISNGLKQAGIALYGGLAERIQVIPNGVEEFWFEQEPACPSQNGNYVLYVGRLHPVKGVDVLLRSWQRVVRRVDGLELWVVGDGPEEGNLRALADSLGIAGNVRFIGAVTDRERLRSLYRGARVVVVPSRSEGLGNVLLEAGACGALRIASAIGGIPEIIEDGLTGFLAPKEDVCALAERIEQVLSLCEAERLRISEGARSDTYERFSLEKVVDQYISVYTALVRR